MNKMLSHEIWTQKLYALRRRTFLRVTMWLMVNLLGTRTHHTNQATTPIAIIPRGRLSDHAISKAVIDKWARLLRLVMSIRQRHQQNNSDPDALLQSSSVYCELHVDHSRILARHNWILVMDSFSTLELLVSLTSCSTFDYVNGH